MNLKLEQIELKRQKFVVDYNREVLRNITLEQYAMGTGGHDNFCYRIELEQEGMGNIRGTMRGVQRYGVWFDKKKNSYDYTNKYGDNPQEAFYSVRTEICNLLDAGEIDDLAAIRGSKLAPLFRYKLLAMYYPNRYLTIFSVNHLSYFCDKVGIPAVDGDDELVMQGKLLQWKESQAEIRNYSMLEYVEYLYKRFGKPDSQITKFNSKPSLKKLKAELAEFDNKHPKRTLTEVERTERSALVAKYVKERAGGICQLCNKPAPFYNKTGEPYLECHHIVWLAKGGSDEVRNAVALCPNCHRKMHALNEPGDVERLKEIARK